MPRNRQILLRSRPEGMPTLQNFELVETDVRDPGPGQVLIRNHMLSLDPYMRGIMNEGESYLPPSALGSVMRGHTIGEVVHSNAEGFRPGDVVFGYGGWQNYAVQSAPPLRKIDTTIAPPASWLGPLGLPGWSAYFGLFDLGSPKAGETLVVSTAAGAVGSPVGQMAKLHGLRARVIVCGLMSQYNEREPVASPDFGQLLKRRISVRGFFNGDHRERFAGAIEDMGAWLHQGKLKFREHIVEGLQRAPEAFIGMLQGQNFGKALVRLEGAR
jgi:NADPH-dependent curcumin reductase CurA